jgi:hypothetical protein
MLRFVAVPLKAVKVCLKEPWTGTTAPGVRVTLRQIESRGHRLLAVQCVGFVKGAREVQRERGTQG